MKAANPRAKVLITETLPPVMASETILVLILERVVTSIVLLTLMEVEPYLRAAIAA